MGKGGGRKNSGRSFDCYTIECGTWNRIHKESIWNSKSQMYLKSQVLMDLNDPACNRQVYVTENKSYKQSQRDKVHWTIKALFTLDVRVCICITGPEWAV